MRGAWRLSADLPDGRSLVAGTDAATPLPPDLRRYLVEQHWPGSAFDEVVVGRWLHVERMSKRTWWMNVAGVVINVDVRRDGTAERLTACLDDRGPRTTYLMDGEPW